MVHSDTRDNIIGSFFLFDRHSSCIFQTSFRSPIDVHDSDEAAVLNCKKARSFQKLEASRSEKEDENITSLQDHAKLVYGVLLSLRQLIHKLSDQTEESEVRTETFSRSNNLTDKLNYFITGSYILFYGNSLSGIRWALLVELEFVLKSAISSADSSSNSNSRPASSAHSSITSGMSQLQVSPSGSFLSQVTGSSPQLVGASATYLQTGKTSRKQSTVVGSSVMKLVNSANSSSGISSLTNVPWLQTLSLDIWNTPFQQIWPNKKPHQLLNETLIHKWSKRVKTIYKDIFVKYLCLNPVLRWDEKVSAVSIPKESPELRNNISQSHQLDWLAPIIANYFGFPI